MNNIIQIRDKEKSQFQGDSIYSSIYQNGFDKATELFLERIKILELTLERIAKFEPYSEIVFSENTCSTRYDCSRLAKKSLDEWKKSL